MTSLGMCVLLLTLIVVTSAQQQLPPNDDYSTKVCGCSTCGKDLGMYTEEIADSALSASSSFDHRNTGPHNARIRQDENGGAWCPKSPVHSEVYEWLQIDLGNLTVITHVETQGRFGNGVGQEFTPQYQLEYQRIDDGPWIRFRNTSGHQLLEGNTNTYQAVVQKLQPAIIAKRLRIVPHSSHPRTVCMRVELYGCDWADGTVSYAMRQGDTRGAELDLFDYTYDGDKQGVQLEGGLGQLVDFQEGDENLRSDLHDTGKKGFEWIGWKNETPHTGPVEITFTFNNVRNFSQVRLHTHNSYTKDVRVFRQARVYFSIGGEYYTSEPVIYDYQPDDIAYSRYVDIPIPNMIGMFVKIKLYYAARWILVSEVRFENDIAEGGPFEPEEEPLQTSPPPPLKSTGSVKNENKDGSNDHNTIPGTHNSRDHTYMAILVGALAVLLVLSVAVVMVVVIRKRQRNKKYESSPLKMFIGHDHFNFHLSDVSPNGKMNNGNVYKGVASDDSSDSYVKDDSFTNLTSQASSSQSHNPDRNKEYNTYTETGHEPIQFRKLPEVPARGATEGSQGEYASTDISNYPNLMVNLPPTPVFHPARKHEGRDASPPPQPPPPQPQAMCAAMSASSNLNIQGLVGNSVYAVPSELLLKDEFAVMDFPRQNLRYIEKLGQGQFGEVHLCEALGIPDYLGDDFLVNRTQNSNSMLVAVKTLRPDACRQARADFHTEVQILSRLKDPAIVRVLGASTGEDPLLVVVEYMRYGDLNHFLKQHVPEDSSLSSTQPHLTYGSLIFMANQIASGMKYLESLNMVHRDLATRNCLVGNYFKVKISDFGMSRSLYSDDYYRIEGKAVLPIRWMAWESVLLGKFSTRSDVWSFAVTLWEILTFARYQPFDDLSDDQVIDNCGHYYRQDGDQQVPPCPHLCQREIYDLMRECWNRDEMTRPSFREIHMFLQRKNMGYNPRDEEHAVSCNPVL